MYQVDKLLRGEENIVDADADYTGVERRPEHEGREVIWLIAARRGTYKKLGKRSVLYNAKRKIEKAKVQVRARSSTRSGWSSVSLASGAWRRLRRRW